MLGSGKRGARMGKTDLESGKSRKGKYRSGSREGNYKLSTYQIFVEGSIDLAAENKAGTYRSGTREK